MSLRVFFDGRNVKIRNALKEVGGKKMSYAIKKKVTYHDLDSYDYIIKPDGEMQMIKNSLDSKGGFYYEYARPWAERCISETRFFELVNVIKNLEFIKTL